MLERTFIPYDIEKIIQILLDNREEEDIVIWMTKNTRGNYTIRIGYHSFQNMESMNEIEILSIWSKGQ